MNAPMGGSRVPRPSGFRVWIARYGKWNPDAWHDMPPEATAVEPAEGTCFSAEEAAAFIEGFNGMMLVETGGLWAVAVPVRVSYDGDLVAGQVFRPQPLAACRDAG